MYKMIDEISMIRISDGAFIPADPANTDYQDYLAWLSAGNTPEPAEPIPAAPPISATPYQIREALNMLGLRSAVESAVAAGSQSLKDKWQFAQEFKRDNPTVIELGLALGKTDAEMDALFQLAETLTP